MPTERALYSRRWQIEPDHFEHLEELKVDIAVVRAALFLPGETKERAKVFARMLGSKLGA